jgi:peptidoglycan/LPS O-acetylase OafA/YrhL
VLTCDQSPEIESGPDEPVADTAGQSVAQPARLRGLDGLRAIAVGVVMLFHADIPWVRGGYLGVDLFFVISGFLITGLLVDQRQRENAGLLWPFYWRRAKRLLPAVWLMIAAIVIAAASFATDALPRLRIDALASFFYVTNWEMIWHNTSYFESMGRQPLLIHLWSLAIEEQFYLLWAPLVIFGLPRLGRHGMAIATIALGLASVAWMAATAAKIGYPGQTDPSRLYFGTDTHGFQLLFGAALGLLWQPNHHLATESAHGWKPLVLGLGALAAMLALVVLLGEETAWLYPWGLLLSAVASVALIAAATHPGSALGLWLDNRIMRWIGERSYGIYLWHWPIFMLTRPGIDLPTLPPVMVMLVRIVLTIGIAALSYTYVESPIRHGALERIWRNLRMPKRRGFAWRRGIALLAGVSITFSAVASVLLNAPDHSMPAPDVRAVLNVDTKITPAVAMPIIAPVMAPVMTSVIAPTDISVNIAPAMLTIPERHTTTSYTGNDLTAVGDSVLLGSSGLLSATLKGVDVHATVGWQAVDVLKQFKALSQSGHLRPVVLVHLGTNGYITEDQLRQILSLLTDAKRVLLVNTHVPRRWMDVNNELIDHVASDYQNVVVVDWHGASDGHPNYFVSDGVHLNVMGQRVFVAEIMRKGHLVPVVETVTDTKVTAPAKLTTLAYEDMHIPRLSPACLMGRPVSTVLKVICQPLAPSSDSIPP